MLNKLYKNIDKIDNKEKYIQELEEENVLLFNQLHKVQEKLENLYDNKDEQFISETNLTNDINEKQIYKFLVENIKLHTLVNLQQRAIEIEQQNSINALLSNILINGVKSFKNFILLPFKLIKTWISYSQTTPPVELGKNNFQNVINVYLSGGIDAVENLLKMVNISSIMRANAYTALARYLMQHDIQQVVKFARLAWENDPRPFRLKWLAFRIHESGDAVTANAMLDMLPKDVTINASEKNHIRKIRNDSNTECLQKAKLINIEYFSKFYEQKKLIEDLRNSINQKLQQQKALSDKLNIINEEYKNNISILNKKLTEQQKATYDAKEESNNLRKIESIQQQKICNLENEINVITLRTTILLKNLLIQFEPDNQELSKVIRILMGEQINLKKFTHS